MEQANATLKKKPAPLDLTPIQVKSDVQKNVTDGTDTNHLTSSCAGCGGIIIDSDFLETTDKTWHTKCLMCTVCKQTLWQTFYEKEGLPYCQKHYTEMYLSKCAGCGLPNTAQVMNAKDRLYHPECFKCIKCDGVILSGERFALKGNELYCMVDYGHAVNKFLDSKKDKDEKKVGDALLGSAYTDDREKEKILNGKRQRTAISEEQSNGLKLYFENNPTPDPIQRAQVALDLGLPKRVVQVWFQNKRASRRKSDAKLSKELHANSPRSHGRMNSGDFMASSMMSMGPMLYPPSPTSFNMNFQPISPQMPTNMFSNMSINSTSQSDLDLVNRMASVQLMQSNNMNNNIFSSSLDSCSGTLDLSSSATSSFSSPQLANLCSPYNSRGLILNHGSLDSLPLAGSPMTTPNSMLMEDKNTNDLSTNALLDLSGTNFLSDNSILSDFELSMQNDPSLALLLESVCNASKAENQNNLSNPIPSMDNLVSPNFGHSDINLNGNMNDSSSFIARNMTGGGLGIANTSSFVNNDLCCLNSPSLFSNSEMSLCSTQSLPNLLESLEDLTAPVHRPKTLQLRDTRSRTPYQRDGEITSAASSPVVMRKKMIDLAPTGNLGHLGSLVDPSNSFGMGSMDSFNLGF